MGKRVENWLSKTVSRQTQYLWRSRWMKFADWIVTTLNLLTDQPYLACTSDEVDDVIRQDFACVRRISSS